MHCFSLRVNIYLPECCSNLKDQPKHNTPVMHSKDILHNVKNIQIIVIIMNNQMQRMLGAKNCQFFSLTHYHRQVDTLMY